MSSQGCADSAAWPPGAYLTPATRLALDRSMELRERKSRFLTFIGAVQDEDELRASLAEVQTHYPDANHHCWASRLEPERDGAEPVERCSDDGEPAGTAGLPMLQVLRGAELCGVLAVVVRWFGGIKLGKGGLVRAYAEATRLALAELPTRLCVPSDPLVVELPYEVLGAVKRLIHPPEVELVDEVYGAGVHMTLNVHRHRRQAVEEALAELRLTPEPPSPVEPVP